MASASDEQDAGTPARRLTAMDRKRANQIERYVLVGTGASLLLLLTIALDRAGDGPVRADPRAVSIEGSGTAHLAQDVRRTRHNL